MANTYSQIYIQVVFHVKGSDSLLKEAIRERVEKYICGIITNNKCKPLAIYCNPDHTHVLIGLHPTCSISDLMRDVKASSSKFIHETLNNKWFQWQDGYGVFSYSHSQIDAVVKYILNQPEHHKKRTFKEEYLDMLQKADIDYDERYLFEWITE